MKKIAFMFVAAALFVACGEKKAPAQEVEVEEVAEVVEEDDTTATDTTATDTTVVEVVEEVAE